MAYITIHPIKSTLKKAIDYICNPQKTENQKNISSMFCNFKTADKMFERTRKNSNSNVKLLAFHVVQSFKKAEVTVGQAQAVGRETVRRFLHDEYEFVIATHNDTNCIHNHIIINSLNMITGKSFSREHDRKNAPAWKVLRKISDEILIENGLSVIEEPEKTGKSHYEWSMNKQGKSWKSKLRKIIDETIRNSSDFESFTEQLIKRNISVRYEPYKTKEGMILAFKTEGQKNYIYSQKLGKYYLENAIKRRIERCVRRKDMNPIERRQERILNDDGVLKRLYDVSEFKEVGLREWAKKENRKLQMQTLNILHERGFSSAYEFNNYYTGLQTKISDNSNLYSGLKDKKQALQVQLNTLKSIMNTRKYTTITKIKPCIPTDIFAGMKRKY